MRTKFTIPTLALLCSVSLTSCWPRPEKNTEPEQVETSKIQLPHKTRHLRSEAELAKAIKEGNVVVDFYADWCGPCKRLGPILDELSTEFPDVQFIKVNVDSYRNLSNKHNIRGIPALIFFKNGSVAKKIVGLKSKNELRSTINTVFG